ncbi:hypothetical protein MJN76_29460, partial [Salmonella enterica subsp. enterica serovar Anatum]|nr:hypothetical protein [Salmonella enterica subsp. enterica serovar Anatum]
QQSIHYLKAENYAAYGNLDAQKAQDDMEQVYDQWLSQNAQLIGFQLFFQLRNFAVLQFRHSRQVANATRLLDGNLRLLQLRFNS